MHRDIKLENILVTQGDKGENMTIKLTDFGFACFFADENQMNVNLGTPCYMAPEIIKKKPYGSGVDIWAMGVLAHIIVTGRQPF